MQATATLAKSNPKIKQAPQRFLQKEWKVFAGEMVISQRELAELEYCNNFIRRLEAERHEKRLFIALRLSVGANVERGSVSFSHAFGKIEQPAQAK